MPLKDDRRRSVLWARLHALTDRGWEVHVEGRVHGGKVRVFAFRHGRQNRKDAVGPCTNYRLDRAVAQLDEHALAFEAGEDLAEETDGGD